MKVGKVHHYLAYIAAAVALVSVILAGICRLAGQPVGLQIPSYMSLATVSLLFAIYFLVEGAVYYVQKGK